VDPIPPHNHDKSELIRPQRACHQPAGKGFLIIPKPQASHGQGGAIGRRKKVTKENPECGVPSGPRRKKEEGKRPPPHSDAMPKKKRLMAEVGRPVVGRAEDRAGLAQKFAIRH